MDEKVVVEITGAGNAAVVAFKAASVSNTEEILAASRQIKGFIEENHPGKVVFDFGAVKFFSSEVLGLLLDIRAELQAYKGEVVISAVNPRLYRVFEVTNLNKIFKFFPDEQSAVKTISIN